MNSQNYLVHTTPIVLAAVHPVERLATAADACVAAWRRPRLNALQLVWGRQVMQDQPSFAAIHLCRYACFSMSRTHHDLGRLLE